MFYKITIIFNENHIIAEKFNMTSVYLRKRKGTKGRLNLYLDYYPALFNPLTRKTKRHESLKMFIYEHPKNMVEQNYNEETLKLAEAIRCKRSISIMSKDLGFFEESFGKCDFLEFFEKLALTMPKGGMRLAIGRVFWEYPLQLLTNPAEWFHDEIRYF